MYKAVLTSFIIGSCFLAAHEDPHDVIDTLTHRLEHATESKKADLYFQRAVEYRVSGQKHKAVADFLKYTKLEPKNYLGWLELGKIYESKERLHFLTKAAALSETNDGKAKAYHALAESEYNTGDYIQALSFCELVIQLEEAKNITPLLFKAHLLWRLDKLEGRVNFLSSVKKIHKSVVLDRALIDAQIDAGRLKDVKPVIMKEMADSRFKSSWQIRAALCESAGSEKSKDYAQAAIKEILTRLNEKRPDITLLMDLACAYSLIGEYEVAGRYLERAKHYEFSPWAMAELEQRVKTSPKLK